MIKVAYEAQATFTGGCDGKARVRDGNLDIRLATLKALDRAVDGHCRQLRAPIAGQASGAWREASMRSTGLITSPVSLAWIASLILSKGKKPISRSKGKRPSR